MRKKEMMTSDAVFIEHQPCPNCGSSDALAVYSDGHKYCFSCGYYIPPEEGGQKAVSYKEFEEHKEHEFLMVGFQDLKKRRIRKDTAAEYGYGVAQTSSGEWVQVAPYYWRGELKAQHVRKPKTKETDVKRFYWIGSTGHLELFGQHLVNKYVKYLIITEGEIDALSVAQSIKSGQYAAVSVPNGAVSADKYLAQNLEFLQRFERIILWFDDDEPGHKALEKAVQILPIGKVYIVKTDEKDANDVLLKHGADAVYNAVIKAQLYRPDSIVSLEDVDLENLLHPKEHINYEVGFRGFNNFLGGLRKHELTLIAAGTGVGKSTFMRQLAYDLIERHRAKVGYIALEESVEKTIISFIALDNNIHAGKLFLDRSLLSEEEWRKSYEKLKDRILCYNHFGSLSPDSLVNQIEYMALALNVDFVILDHISIVVSGLMLENERQAIDSFITKLRGAIENKLPIGVIAAIHLNSNKHVAHEEGARVKIQDIRGSLAPAQFSDVIIALERDIQNKDPVKRGVTQVRLLKSRLMGNTGLMFATRMIDGKLVEVETHTPEGMSFGNVKSTDF